MSELTEKTKQAANFLQAKKKVVILTGAGVSAESNVPTFRGKDGWWKNHRPEDLATPEAFRKDPAFVWEWYGHRQKLVRKCSPNPAHYSIARMEELFEEFVLITQNVDGLHRQAGSRKILELHGDLFRARCTSEGTVTDFELGEDPLPKCKSCGALLRPHVVWFGESLDSDVIRQSLEASASCDVFIVAGTSAMVQPAASFPLYARSAGAMVIEINPEPTPITPLVNLSIGATAGEALSKILEEYLKK